MKTSKGSFLKTALCCFLLVLLIAIPVSVTWAATLTKEELSTWRMWIRLAINGYAEPLKVEKRTTESWMKYLPFTPK
ncbi:MAG: hypothetical protein JNJ77_13820 [Planctomycetia bacterium]|nr:hypothetical protein [Planctomycetia bacterium]